MDSLVLVPAMKALQDKHKELLLAREALYAVGHTMPEFRGQFAIQARMKWRRENTEPLQTKIRKLETEFIALVHESELYDLFVEYQDLTYTY